VCCLVLTRLRAITTFTSELHYHKNVRKKSAACMLIMLTTAASGCFVTTDQNCAAAACGINRKTICSIGCILRSLPSPTILPTNLPRPAQFRKITISFSSADSVQEAVLHAVP
jgi:hypothetical protein